MKDEFKVISGYEFMQFTRRCIRAIKRLNKNEGKLKNHQFVPINIWGQEGKIKIRSRRYDFDKEMNRILYDEEAELLNFVLEHNLINDEKVKKAVLEYINGIYAKNGQPPVESILAPEVILRLIYIDEPNRIIAFVGDCKCDEKNGISVLFVDGEFVAVADYYAYEIALEYVDIEKVLGWYKDVRSFTFV